MFFLALLACGQASYSDRLDAFRAEMAPRVAEAKALDLAKLPEGDAATAKGRRILFVENGEAQYVTTYEDGEDRIPPPVAATAEEVGVIVVATAKKNAEKSWSYQDGTRGYGQSYTFVAVSTPEHTILRRWTGAASPSLQKYDTTKNDVLGYYVSTDYIEDATQLEAGQDPGQTEMGAAMDAFKAAVAPVVDAVKSLPADTTPVEGAVPAGRKVLVMMDGWAHDTSFRPLPWAAPDAASVGIVASVVRVPDEAPSVTFDDGTPGYGGTFTITVLTWPDKTVVRRWSEHVDPPTSVLDAKRTRVDAHYDLMDLGAKVFAGGTVGPAAAP